MPRYSPHAAPPSNRIFLAVSFHEKEMAKVLGARWDQCQRTWWIARRTAEQNPSIHRWVLDREIARCLKEADDFIRRGSQRIAERDIAPTKAVRDAAGAIAATAPHRALAPLPVCDCTTPPWEHCLHTTALAA
jgi:Domain of unknown function (DUF5710)